MVLAHTPFRRLAAEGRLRERPVLVAGAGRPAAVAREYGFRQVPPARPPCPLSNADLTAAPSHRTHWPEGAPICLKFGACPLARLPAH